MAVLWRKPATPGQVEYIEITTFVPPAFLVPGSTPGTWRIKEPPEGAVTKE